MTVYIIGYQDKIPDGAVVIETTSRSKNWSKGLSPFFVGPVEVWPGQMAKNVENAWQFSKVYPEHSGIVTNSSFNIGSWYQPTDAHYLWAQKGFEDDYAHRYPMGKGVIPEYSIKFISKIPFVTLEEHSRIFQVVIGTSYRLFKKLNYIESRKELYIPFYAGTVVKTEAYSKLEDILFENPEKDLYLKDFDGYNHKALGMSYDDVINCESRKMGHAFVLGMLLDGFINKNDYLVEQSTNTSE